jgi:hypothetical protein
MISDVHSDVVDGQYSMTLMKIREFTLAHVVWIMPLCTTIFALSLFSY